MSILSRLEALAERSRGWPDKVSEITSRITDDSDVHEIRDGPPVWGPRTFSSRDREPRSLADGDIDSFLVASGEAREQAVKDLDKRHPPKAFDVERKTFLQWVALHDARRLNRLGRELDWLRNEARRYGINPEEIRWLL